MLKSNFKWAALTALILSGCARQTATAPATAPAGSPASMPASATASAPVKAPVAAMPPDVLGRAVPLQTPAQRAVVIGPGAVEIVYALGAQGHIVGRDQSADFPPAALKLPVAGDYQGPNVETVVAMKSDLIIIQGEGYDAARVDKLQRQVGVPVAMIGAQSVDQLGADIERIGAWLGAPDKAQALAKPFAGATQVAPDAPTAFIEVGRSPQLYTAGANTLLGDALGRAGFANAAKVKGYQPYNIENLLTDDPRYYIVPTKKSQADELSELRKNPTLSKLEAVRAGRVIAVNSDWMLRPGPRLKLAIDAMRAARSK